MKSNSIRKIANKIAESEKIVGENSDETKDIPYQILSGIKAVGINPDLIVESMKSHGTASLLLSGQMLYPISLLAKLSVSLKSDFNVSAKSSNILISNIKLN